MGCGDAGDLLHHSNLGPILDFTQIRNYKKNGGNYKFVTIEMKTCRQYVFFSQNKR